MTKPQDSSKEYIWGKRKNKTRIIIAIVVGVVLIGVVGFFIFAFNPNQNTNSFVNTSQDGAVLIRRAIDGVYVPADQANNYPVAVMIENLVSSRPPSGLAKANLVYEALVEGGITRFMAVYAGNVNVKEIGPVRSARPYYLDWALEYNAMYVHVGGSPEAIANIKTYNVLDLNQFYNSPNFWRDSNRQAPHNLYTSSELLAYGLRDKNPEMPAKYTSWKFKDDAALVDRPTVDKSVVIDFSSFNYKVEYKYDKEKNDYLRYLAGQIHKDKDEAEIRAKNVVVQKVKTRLADAERLAMDTVGQGEAIIFRDGVATVGRWEKSAREKRTIFFDTQGREIQFNAGTTWIEIVPTDRDIVYN